MALKLKHLWEGGSINHYVDSRKIIIKSEKSDQLILFKIEHSRKHSVRKMDHKN